MPSSQRSGHKAHGSRSQRKRRQTLYSHQNKQMPTTPRAPDELNAMLGYGTSSSFPLFMSGVTRRIKEIFGHKNTRE